MKKILSVCLILMLCVGMLAGCGGDETTNNNEGQAGGTENNVAAIKIGGTGPLTGGAAIYGLAAKQGAEIAVEEINALGGLQFELKYEDDANDAEKAANAYNVIKDWGMQLSLGSVTSTPATATSSKNYEDKIFAITPSASATAVTEGKDNVFQMCFTDPGQGAKSAQYIYEQNLGEKIAIIYKNDEVYSTGIYETFIAEAEELGLNVVSTTTFTTDSQTDFSVQLGEAKNAGADLVFLPMYYEPASLILTQANSMGYAPKFFGVDGMDGILTLDGFDTSLAEGVMLLTSFSADAQDDMTVNFVTKYQDKYGETPNQFAAGAYDCIYALYNACTNAGVTADMTAEEINALMIEQFTTMSFDGLTGTEITWSSDGAVSKDPRGMVIQDGVYVGM